MFTISRKVADVLELYLLTFIIELELTRCAPQPVILPVPPVSLTTPGAWAACQGPPCIMGSAFPTAQIIIFWTPTADVEVGPIFELPWVKGWRSAVSVLPFPSLAACHSSCTSCWGPAVSQCTSCPGWLLLHQGQCVETCGEGHYSQDQTCQSKKPSTSNQSFILKTVEENLPFWPSLPPFQTVIPPVGPAWGRWPQTASSVSNQKKWCCRSSVKCSTACAWLCVLHTNTWMTGRRAEVSAKACFWCFSLLEQPSTNELLLLISIITTFYLFKILGFCL